MLGRSAASKSISVRLVGSPENTWNTGDNPNINNLVWLPMPLTSQLPKVSPTKRYEFEWVCHFSVNFHKNLGVFFTISPVFSLGETAEHVKLRKFGGLGVGSETDGGLWYHLRISPCFVPLSPALEHGYRSRSDRTADSCAGARTFSVLKLCLSWRQLLCRWEGRRISSKGPKIEK